MSAIIQTHSKTGVNIPMFKIDQKFKNNVMK